jgi:DNA-directed RNA polymerase subunit RPC12/RpoP
MTTYNCKDCGKSVELSKGGEFVRPCGCSAPIIANLKATARGASSVAGSRA